MTFVLAVVHPFPLVLPQDLILVRLCPQTLSESVVRCDRNRKRDCVLWRQVRCDSVDWGGVPLRWRKRSSATGLVRTTTSRSRLKSMSVMIKAWTVTICIFAAAVSLVVAVHNAHESMLLSIALTITAVPGSAMIGERLLQFAPVPVKTGNEITGINAARRRLKLTTIILHRSRCRTGVVPYFDRRSRMLRVILTTDGSFPRRP